jgi:hypothetical protein
LDKILQFEVDTPPLSKIPGCDTEDVIQNLLQLTLYGQSLQQFRLSIISLTETYLLQEEGCTIFTP